VSCVVPAMKTLEVCYTTEAWPDSLDHGDVAYTDENIHGRHHDLLKVALIMATDAEIFTGSGVLRTPKPFHCLM